MKQDCNENKMERNVCEFNGRAETSILVKSLQEERRRHVKEERGNSTPSKTDGGGSQWASCKDFNVEAGKQQIDACIKTWEIRSCWIYSVEFVRTEQEDDFTIYLYEALFMAPTARKPISDRVSVYFAVEVSKSELENPVELRFILESRRLVHTPGRDRFSEKWLTDITETKALLQKMMDL